jgi:hypothetical protein
MKTTKYCVICGKQIKKECEADLSFDYDLFEFIPEDPYDADWDEYCSADCEAIAGLWSAEEVSDEIFTYINGIKADVIHGCSAFNRVNSRKEVIERLENTIQMASSGENYLCGCSARHIGPFGIEGEATIIMHSPFDVWSGYGKNGARFAHRQGHNDHDEYWFKELCKPRIWIKDWFEYKFELIKWADAHNIDYYVIYDKEKPDWLIKKENEKEALMFEAEELLIEQWEVLL